jgi:hypothetical protein
MITLTTLIISVRPSKKRRDCPGSSALSEPADAATAKNALIAVVPKPIRKCWDNLMGTAPQLIGWGKPIGTFPERVTPPNQMSALDQEQTLQERRKSQNLPPSKFELV